MDVKNQGTKLIFFPKDSYFCYKKEKEKKHYLHEWEKECWKIGGIIISRGWK